MFGVSEGVDFCPIGIKIWKRRMGVVLNVGRGWELLYSNG
jgi:hypothetical protein